MAIKVQLIHQAASVGRGIGFYAQQLQKHLTQIPQIELITQNPDLIHYTFFDLFYPTLPFLKKYSTIVTIHDVTPLVLSSLYPKGIKSWINLQGQKLSLFNVKAIITDSQNSKKDIAKHLLVLASRIHVVPLAADPIYSRPVSPVTLKKIKAKYRLPDQFILMVSGGPNPNKNLPALAQVTSELKIPLVIVGGGLLQELPLGPVHPELRDLAQLAHFSHLILPGFVPNEDLSAIYRLAALYCQPSLYEGFGLPVLEAMAAGCLVVSSNTSSLPEVYPPDTITFNPADHSSIKTALEKSLTLSAPIKQKKIENGLKRAQDFSWQTTANQTLEVYKTIL